MLIIDELISKYVKDKDFADIGPLWETVNEKLSIASHFGAKSLMAIDQFPDNHPLWDAFHNRMTQGGILDYHIKSCNLLDYSGPAFDVVHCAGVIYHAPDPITFIKKLRSITKERLILTSTVMPERISNELGEFILPEGGIVFVPSLSQANKKIINAYWNRFLKGRPSGGLTDNIHWDAGNYYYWWWLFTSQVLTAMCSSCNFKVDFGCIENDVFIMSMS